MNAKRVAVYSIVAILVALNVWQFSLRRVEQDVPFPFAGLQPRPLSGVTKWPATEGAHLLPEKFKLNDEQQKIVDDFHKLFYSSGAVSWGENRWLGFECLQNPNDIWMTQEILHEVKPDLVIETGTYKGGSAILWSSLLELIKPEAKLITIDVGDYSAAARQHPLFQRRVTFILGSSTSPEVVDRVRELARGKKTLVILDSDHKADHVLAELRAFKDIVSPGSYIIVQDTNINGHPVMPGHGPGPMEAVQQFLSETTGFVVDRNQERLLFTMHPSGYLKRQS